MEESVRHGRHREEKMGIKTKKFIVVFTNGNAMGLIATSVAAAKRMTQGSFDQFGNARKVLSIREVSISSDESQ